jgi:hypothetical protein
MPSQKKRNDGLERELKVCRQSSLFAGGAD